MKLKDVGERSLLELAQQICEAGPSVIVGVGDDGAAIKTEKDTLVTTTDMIIEKIHFPLNASVQYISTKAVVTNLSDLAAMGARPLGLVFSIGAPGETEVDFISELLQGMNSTARKYGVYLVGGDLNEASEIIISGAAFGEADEEELLLRSGARAGDIIGMTGELGIVAAGVRAMLEDISIENKELLKDGFKNPVARTKEGMVLSQSGGVTSAIDITDGLASNLWQISRMSEVGLVIDDEKLPIPQEVRDFSKEQGIELDELTLYGGEDFELIFTVRPDTWDDVATEIRKLGTKVSRIGEVNAKEGVSIKRKGELEELPDRGYKHFK